MFLIHSIFYVMWVKALKTHFVKAWSDCLFQRGVEALKQSRTLKADLELWKFVME